MLSKWTTPASSANSTSTAEPSAFDSRTSSAASSSIVVSCIAIATWATSSSFLLTLRLLCCGWRGSIGAGRTLSTRQSSGHGATSVSGSTTWTPRPASRRCADWATRTRRTRCRRSDPSSSSTFSFVARRVPPTPRPRPTPSSRNGKIKNAPAAGRAKSPKSPSPSSLSSASSATYGASAPPSASSYPSPTSWPSTPAPARPGIFSDGAPTRPLRSSSSSSSCVVPVCLLLLCSTVIIDCGLLNSRVSSSHLLQSERDRCHSTLCHTSILINV
mmetsp:Transcript_4963/g.15587  ORF Transcript_4963/g.15587 Transcript_4963/m.15587 type:complete len:273 (-) Transcript_4963:16-834(-)